MKPPQAQPPAEHESNRTRALEPIFPVADFPVEPFTSRHGKNPRHRLDHAWLAALLPLLVLFL